MSAFSLTIKVEASPEKTFEVFSDLSRAAERIEGITRIEILDEGPTRVGTRWRETRKMFGKETTEEMAIAVWDPNNRYSVGADSCGCRFETTFRFAAQGSGTRVEIDFQSQPLTLLAKLTAPLGWLMMGPMKKCFEKDLEDLKAAAQT